MTTVIEAADPASITRALQAILEETPDLFGVPIDRSGAIPEDSSDWIGIYGTGIRYDSRALGVATGFRMQRFALLVLVRTTSTNDGEQCEDRLGELVKAVMSAVLNNPTLRGTVANLTEDLNVIFDTFQKDDTEPYVQEATIFINAEIYVNVKEV